jgi:hypothetical protein
MVEGGKKSIWQNILKNSNDATCHIFRLPCVNKLLVCISVASVVASVVATHIWQYEVLKMNPGFIFLPPFFPKVGLYVFGCTLTTIA